MSVKLLSYSEVLEVLIVCKYLDFIGRTTKVRPLLPECFDNSY